jgi:hypothetical protein
MASRWAYEAIAVTQYKWNDYEEQFFDYEKRKKFSNWKKDYWITELDNRVSMVKRSLNDESVDKETRENLNLLQNELSKENAFLDGLKFQYVADLTAERVTPFVLDKLSRHLTQLNEHYKNVYNQAEMAKEKAIYAMTKTDKEQAEYQQLFNNYKNDQLEIFTTNRNDLSYIAEYQGELVQKKDLVYLMPYNSTFFGTHFYAPAKKLFGRFIDTFYANVLVLWGMTAFLILCLFFNVFPRLLGFVEANVQIKRRR